MNWIDVGLGAKYPTDTEDTAMHCFNCIGYVTRAYNMGSMEQLNEYLNQNNFIQVDVPSETQPTIVVWEWDSDTSLNEQLISSIKGFHTVYFDPNLESNWEKLGLFKIRMLTDPIDVKPLDIELVTQDGITYKIMRNNLVQRFYQSA